MLLSLEMLHLLAQAGPPAPPEQQGVFTPAFVITMVVIFAAFYFLIQKPQQRAQKEKEQARDSMKKGDAVVTIGGIHGKVIRLNKNKGTVVVEVAKGVEMEFTRSAVNAAVIEAAEKGGKSAPEDDAEEEDEPEKGPISVRKPGKKEKV